MEKKGLVICCVVGLLGLLSASAGFGAEATRIKVPTVEFLLGSSLLFQTLFTRLWFLSLSCFRLLLSVSLVDEEDGRLAFCCQLLLCSRLLGFKV